MKRSYCRRWTGRSGSALIVAVLFMLVLGGMAASLVAMNGAFHKEHQRSREATLSFYLAESGINEAYASLVTVGDTATKTMVYPRTLGQGTYSVEQLYGQDDDTVIRLDRVRLRSVGDGGEGPVGVELMTWKVPTGSFRWGIFGDEWVDIDSNSLVDSYNSNDGPYDPNTANDFGNVGSNGSVNIDSNSQIYGEAMVGPTGTLDDSDPGVLVAGETGVLATPEPMPVIVVPSIAVSGALIVNGAMTLPPGDRHLSALTVNGGGTLTVQGPARLVLDSAVVKSNSTWIIDATNGPVEIYGTGTFDLRSNSTLTTIAQHARDISLSITSSNLTPPAATIAFNSNASFIGTIYAPNALVSLASNFGLFGAVKAKQVRINSNSNLHFDEDLLYDPNVPQIYERLAWRPLSMAEVTALGF
jgi:hypothetical protein